MPRKPKASATAVEAIDTVPVKSKSKLKAEAKVVVQNQIDILGWVHLHTLSALWEMPRHAEMLNRLSRDSNDTLPNLLFYGSNGFPLEYMAYALIHKDTGAAAPMDVVKNECLWDNKLPYYECAHFFEVQCRHPDMPKEYDILCDFMKHILNTHCIHAQKHIFILRDIDVICQSDYHFALRVLLERFSHNVLFIATTHSLSKIEAPLLSRFMLVRVPQPSPVDVKRLRRRFQLGDESDGEGDGDPPRTFVEWMYRLRAGALPEDKKLLEQFITQSPPPSFPDIRYYAYRCFQKGIPFAKFCYLLIQYSRTVKYKAKLVAELAELEHQLVQSTRGREPIYYEKALWMTIFVNSLWK